MSPESAVESTSFAGRRAVVLGLGRFAGGLETTRFLRAEGAEVLVSDTAAPALLAEQAAAAESLGARVVFGPQGSDLLDRCDVLLVNPAIPFEHPVLAAAQARGIPITTEINIVLARCRAPVLAVTGTKGKSTTSSILVEMLRAAGRTTHFGGNIGQPLVAQLQAIEPDHRVVLELSSFQLYWTRLLGRSPHLTLMTNLLSDHLDRHGTQAAYAEAKRAALDYQGAQDVAVLPTDDAAMRAAGWHAAGAGRRVLYGAGAAYRLEDGEV
ncbi:MAG: Mur ligase family protein, partial [Planctomycetota bacterium]|nr:Mur ligase family protein [Planctomycetota bacterium]